MSEKTRKHDRPAFVAGRWEVWYAGIDAEGDPAFDIRCEGFVKDPGLSIEGAIAEASRLARKDRVEELTETFDEFLGYLGNDSEETVRRLEAAVAAIKG